MKPIFGLLLLFLLLMALVWAGCDSPSKSQDQTMPYHVVATFPMPAAPRDVEALGDLAAVADGAYGALLLNVRDLAHINILFRDTLPQLPRGLYSTAAKVALDTVNHLLVMATEPQDSANPFFTDYATGQTVSQLTVPKVDDIYYQLKAEYHANDLRIWGTTRTEFHSLRICRDTDTSAWSTCDPGFTPYTYPNTDYGVANRAQGFAIRAGDQVVALGVEGAGVHFLNGSTGAVISTFPIPGSAYDCAWYQDSLLVVAAQFQMVILNARDATHPFIVSELPILNSDDMIGLAIDGNWACILDGHDGIYVVNISNPRNPAYVQLLPLSGPTAVYFDGGRLYATDAVAGLVVYSR